MSEKNMDDLLAQLKAEFEPTRESSKNPQQSSPRSQQQPPRNPTSAIPVEQMLGELRTELESARNTPKHHRDRQQPESVATPTPVKSNESKYRERLHTLIDQDYQMQARKREARFAELRKQEAAQIAEQKRRQQELVESQHRAELREQKRQQAMQANAQQWLNKLNPNSEEGRWFEEFSYSYDTKLKAAIDYLEAMKESGL